MIGILLVVVLEVGRVVRPVDPWLLPMVGVSVAADVGVQPNRVTTITHICYVWKKFKKSFPCKIC